jgi:hypothetical protein
MAHGLPDWGGRNPKSTTYGLQDMAELAVRLGSIVTFDRRGDVVFVEDFSNGLGRWALTGSGTGNTAYPVIYPVKTKGMGINLHTGNAAFDASDIYREVSFPVAGKIGLEASFVVYPGIRVVSLWISIYTGISLYMYAFGYKHTTGQLTVYTPSGYVYFATPGIINEAYANYQTIKVVIDTVSPSYIRGLFNEHAYVLSDYTPKIIANAETKRCVVYIDAVAEIVGGKDVVVSDIIVTQNEP